VTASAVSLSGPSDELLSLTEVGRILGTTRMMTVHRMAVAGVLEGAYQGPPRKNWRIPRASAERVAAEWSRRISTGAAAAMLGVGTDKFRELLRTGALTRHRYSPEPISIDEVQHLINTDALADPVHRGRIPTRQAAQQLGLNPNTLAHLATADRIPATRDRRGRWWFRPEHIELSDTYAPQTAVITVRVSRLPLSPVVKNGCYGCEANQDGRLRASEAVGRLSRRVALLGPGVVSESPMPPSKRST
jgi:hypothetical protein